MAEFHVKRCFVALPLDEVVIADLADVMADLTLPGLRRTPLENLHVTVKFLGDVDDPQMPQVIEALELATENVPPFELEVQDLTYLPHQRRPRLIAARMDRPDALAQLHTQVEDLTHAVGFQKEGRAYNPHVTLGRYRKPPRETADLTQPNVRLQSVDTGCRVNRVTLMQSILESTGPRYAQLADFPLTP